MKGLTLSAKEHNRLQILNGVIERHWSMTEAAQLMGVSERHGWRLLAGYRKKGAVGLAHGNRGRRPSNATPEHTRDLVIALAQGTYKDVNHTHLSELLAEREGVKLSRPTVRRILVGSGLKSPRRGRRPRHRYRRQRNGRESPRLA